MDFVDCEGHCFIRRLLPVGRGLSKDYSELNLINWAVLSVEFRLFSKLTEKFTKPILASFLHVSGDQLLPHIHSIHTCTLDVM